MKRWLLFILSLGLLVAVAGCNLSDQSGPTATPIAGGVPTIEQGTVVAATSSIPTSTAQSGGSGGLPTGTLILMQVGKPIAQLPNGQTLSLPSERFGVQGSPNGRYGVRVTQVNDKLALVLVDYGSDPNGTTKEVPQAAGLSGPSVTWKEDSSGFAYFDFPPPDNPKSANGAISYYDIGSGQTKVLVPKPQEAGMIATSIAFSPDGKYLLYAVSPANAEATGGPDSKVFLFDTSANKSTLVPTAAARFNQWLKSSQGFLATRSDPSGVSQILLYNLTDLNNPKVLTPANTIDYLVDSSPDGKFLAVTSNPAGQTAQPPNVFIMGLDGSNRKALTKFNTVDQSITALVWGLDGIYYSLSGTSSTDTTWKMSLDGTNQIQVAQGTLDSIIGAH